MELRQFINLKSLLRISVATIVVSAGIIVGFKWAFPQIAVPNLLPIVFALPAILIALVVQAAILSLVPPTVTIRADKILVQHGQTTIIDPLTVTATCLTFHTEDRIRLRICYTKKSKTKSRVIGVPSTVDFERLSEMLPIAPKIRDARQRSIRPQNHRSK